MANAPVTLLLSSDGLLYAQPGQRITWQPVLEWVEDPTTGRRRPTGPQSRDAEGLPVWEVALLGYQPRYGEREMVEVRLRTSSPTPPDNLELTPILMGCTG